MRLAFAISLALTGFMFSGATRAQDLDTAAVDCYCTDRSGSRVALGQTICLMVDGRAFLARCEMSLNVPAWRDIGEACVGAALMSPWRAGQVFDFVAPGSGVSGGA